MKFVLIPVTPGSSSDEEMAIFPAMIMHLITAIMLSVWATSKFLPDLHGWGRFGVCALFVLAVLILTFVPIIGMIICIANAILWIVFFWLLIGQIPIVWLKWTLRVISILFIVAFESAPILMR